MYLLDSACSERSTFAKLENICKFSLDEVCFVQLSKL